MPTKAYKRWLLPIVLGTVVFAAGLWFVVAAVRIRPPAANATPAPAAPRVVLAAKSDVNQELALLTDLEPLFLPTPWNTSILELPAQSRREPSSMSFSFPPKWAVAEAGGGVTLPEPVPVPANALAVLRVGDAPNPMPEVGRTDPTLPQLPPRLAYIEVRKAGSGSLVFSEIIPPGVEGTGLNGEWAPLEYMVAVDRAGLVGEPQVTRPAGVEAVETYFRGVLAKQMQLGARLPPGFYTVAVGP